MFTLLDALARVDDPVTWFIARVERINAGSPGHVDLVLGDISSPNAVRMTHVPYLDTYLPTVGDLVHGVARSKVGAVILGSTAPARSPSAGGGAPVVNSPVTEHGTATLRWPGGTSTATVDVTFSSPFSQPPTVVVSNSNSYRNAVVGSITTAKCTIGGRTNSDAVVAASTDTVQWIAVGRR